MPADPSVVKDLDRLGISFEEMPCDPDLADTAEFCAAYGVPIGQSANTIVVASRRPEGEVAACLVLATTRLDVNGVVRRRLGVRKVSFANAEQTKSLTDMEIGGVTIFGLPETLPIWVDTRVLDCDWVVVGAGTRSAKIKFDPHHLSRHDRFELVPDLAQDLST
jgi:prolyl-tRNA editing enzyme YbaK/EbsC (Cys-tRNA(Pro) deacylase)